MTSCRLSELPPPMFLASSTCAGSCRGSADLGLPLMHRCMPASSTATVTRKLPRALHVPPTRHSDRSFDCHSVCCICIPIRRYQSASARQRYEDVHRVVRRVQDDGCNVQNCCKSTGCRTQGLNRAGFELIRSDPHKPTTDLP